MLDSILNVPKLEIENPTVEVKTPADLDSQMRKINVSAHSLSTSLLIEEKIISQEFGRLLLLDCKAISNVDIMRKYLLFPQFSKSL